MLRIKRRKFLKAAMVAAVSAPAISCVSRSQSRWRFFTEDEARTLEAICEQLIPADRDPGAKDAGVVNYIDLQLTRFFRPSQDAYREGIAAVNESSGKLFGRAFAELEAKQQVEVLQAMERNQAPGDGWKERGSRQFFDLVLNHAMQGFYGDPRHGGNRDAVSWRMLGLAYPPVRGRGAVQS